MEQEQAQTEGRSVEEMLIAKPNYARQMMKLRYRFTEEIDDDLFLEVTYLLKK